MKTGVSILPWGVCKVARFARPSITRIVYNVVFLSICGRICGRLSVLQTWGMSIGAGEAMKLIYSDFGKGHSSIKWAWFGLVCGLAGNILTFYSRWIQWEEQQQFYFSWVEPPSPPSLTWFMIFNILLIASTVTVTIATGKHEIHIYDNGIEGFGFKFTGLFLREFKLDYADITSVKKHKWGLSIRSAMGRYRVFVSNPELCVDTIFVWKYNRGNKINW